MPRQTSPRAQAAALEEARIPLSFAQERFWYLDQLEPDNPAYNVPAAVRIEGPLNLEALRSALNAIVARHETLRSTFGFYEGQLRQTVSASGTVKVPVIDFGRLSERERESEIRRVVHAEVRCPFKISRDLMLRALLVRAAPDEHVLVLTMHHIAADGWSLGVLFRELSEAYTASCRGEPAGWCELPIRYGDFVKWQRDWLPENVFEPQLSYWKQRLSNLPDCQHVATDYPRPTQQSYVGALERIILPDPLVTSLSVLSQEEGASLFMTLLAAFQVLLGRYSGQDDVVVGTPIANRNRLEVDSLIGCFVNTLVLRADLSGPPTFRELLGRVREVALDAYDHQDLPFEKLVEALHLQRSLSRTPLFQSMFVLQNSPTQDFAHPQLKVTRYELDPGFAKFDLTILIEEKDGFEVALEYNTDLFESTMAKRMLGHYRTLLESAVKNPQKRISHLSILTDEERQKVVVEWNRTERPYPRMMVQQLFEAQVQRNPGAVALAFGAREWTYAELNRRANRIARELRRLGVGSQARVAIWAERSLEMVAGLLGILKAGAAYVPLDPLYPPERLEYVVKDAGAGIVLGPKHCKDKLQPGVTPLCLEALSRPAADKSSENLGVEGATPENIAYVMYTSGSTGSPKGVEIPHRGIVRLLFGVDFARFDDRQVFLQLAPVSFDASTFEIWGALLHGAKCVLFPGPVPAPLELGEVIRKHKVSTLWLTASFFNTIIEQAPEALSTVRQLLTGGEALSLPHMRRALELLPEVQLINAYGPTESTTFTSTYRIPRNLGPVSSIPIGRPIANTEVYILDRYLQPQPVGAPGELYIGGEGLARGYWNRPDLTQENFIPHPFNPRRGALLYKSGDQARYLPDGNLEFMGRLDDQVKIRGFRIELGEIEAALRSHGTVRDAALVVGESEAGEKCLVAYVVPPQGPLAVKELRAFLMRKIPEYMVPSHFVFLEKFPLTSGGKVDRQALRSTKALEASAARTPVSARNDLERQLLELWERVLGIRPLGIRDNFFDLGGHSLLAIRLFLEIEKVFNRRLRTATLLSAPTVEQMAACLGAEGMPRSSPLVAIQPNGSKPPLFCVHGGGGQVLRFRDLASRLGFDQPFYGLQSRDFSDERLQDRVEKIAEGYIGEILTVQPQGPYYLAGASFGGLVAYEMANQLQARGAKIGLLALFDTVNPAFSRSLPFPRSIRYQWTQFFLRLSHYAECLWDASPLAQKLNLLVTPLQTRGNQFLWRTGYALFRSMGYPIPACLQDHLKFFVFAAKRYHPRPYSGRVTLFRAARHDPQYGPDPKLGWAEVAKEGVDVHEVPGDHISILDDPGVGVLAEKLRSCIDRARSAKAVSEALQSSCDVAPPTTIPFTRMP